MDPKNEDRRPTSLKRRPSGLKPFFRQGKTEPNCEAYHRMSSERATNVTSQAIQRVTNCVTQIDFHSMEIYVAAKIFVHVVVANILFFI